MRYGFTLAEILITLLVMTIISAALVPLMYPSKVKVEKVITAHGLIECFYDGDGNLHLYTMDNKDNKDGKDSIMGGTMCSVTLPKANNYKVTVIGAGGDGGGLDKIPYYYDATKTITGKISPDDFYDDMQAAPDFIRNNWGTRYIKYRLDSPIGSGGSSLCTYFQTITGGECNNCTYMPNCPSSCTEYKCENGGNSGYGIRLDAEFPLRVGDSISKIVSSNYVKLTAGNNSLKASASSDGTNAVKDYNYLVPGTDGSNAAYSITGSEVNIESNTKTTFNKYDEEATDGHITLLAPNVFNYEYKGLSANIYYGTKGVAGETKMEIYDRAIGGYEGYLFLTPAKMYPQKSTVQAIITTGGIKQKKTIMSASSGHSGSFGYKNVLISGSDDLPFPQSLHDSVFVKASDSKEAATGLKSKISKLGLNPGSNGSGSYPLIYKLGGDDGIKNTIKIYDSYNPTTTYTEDFAYIEAGNLKCLDGKEPTVSGNRYYCKGTKGSSGAVIIAW